MGTKSLTEHMKNIHSDIEFGSKSHTSTPASTSATEQSNPTQEQPGSSNEGNRKRGGSMAKLYDLCSKEKRRKLFQSTIPGWVEAKHELDFHGPRAQRIHKSIFEKMVVDLDPFYEASKPGFLRMCQQMLPNFRVASRTYYRSLLEPTYDKVRGVLQDRLKSDAPPTISIGLDLWSQFHHGYVLCN